MQDICKGFPGVQALDKVSLRVKPATVHALMGENGAGKSTLMKCLFGIYSKDSGQIYLKGNEVNFKSSKEALSHGVAMVHQELNQALNRSVMDNIWLGRYPKVLKGLPVVSQRKMINDTKAIFKELNIQVDPRAIMNTLPVAQRQMVEIAKAVSYGAKLIVFDEPTSSLTDQEVEHLFRIIHMLRSNNCGIIYISHKMEEILRISDEVTIMRDGRWVATRPSHELDMNQIIHMMVGRELTERFPSRESTISSEIVMEVEGLTAMYTHLKDVSFKLHAGEILGIAGLAGAGRTELLETIFGNASLKQGSVTIKGKSIRIRHPKTAIANGMAMLTEERRATGIFSILNIQENTTIASLKDNLVHKVYLSNRKMRQKTKWAIDTLRIKTPSQKTKIRSLSGGNQQKVIFGRWMLTNPDILLLDEPTRGIDVGAKYEIYQLIIQMAAQGKSVIMVSSEMPELLGVCDRILVMSNGRLAGEVEAKSATQEEIMLLAAKYV